jgi:hypothetical protein
MDFYVRNTNIRVLFIYLMNLLSNLHMYYIRYKDKYLTNERQNTRHKSQISTYNQTEKHKRDIKSPMRFYQV